MRCPSPFVRVVFPEEYVERVKARPQFESLPCGKCLVCLANKRQEWIVRLYYEHRFSKGSHFVTLTYDWNHYPKDGRVSKREIQLFMKRLRKINDKLRYYAVGEYGSKGGRPHYHLLLFGNLDPETIRKAWQKGITHIGTVNSKSIAYCTKYVIQPKKDGAFALMSRGYAIGSQYLSDASVKWHRENDYNHCIIDGKKVKLPRFFKQKIWYDKEELKRISNKSKWEAIRKHRQEIRRLKETGITNVKEYMLDQTRAFISRVKRKVEYTQKF